MEVVTLRILFDEWLPVTHRLFGLLRNNPDNATVTIFATSTDSMNATLFEADKGDTRDALNNEAYLNWVIDYCTKHKIDVLIPRRHYALCSKNISRFDSVGIKVLTIRDSDLVSMLDNKVAFYDSIKQHNIIAVPQYKLFNSSQEFMSAYNTMKHTCENLCIKLTEDTGGKSFRVLDNNTECLSFLTNKIKPNVSFQSVYSILQKHEEEGKEIPQFMIMELLNGLEYSIDCIAYEGKLLTAIPRKKHANSRIRELENKDDLIDIARKIVELYPTLNYAFNLQIMYSEGVPKLLEINPRFSGGLRMSSYSGVNIPYNTIKLLFNDNADTISIPKPSWGLKIDQVYEDILLIDV